MLKVAEPVNYVKLGLTVLCFCHFSYCRLSQLMVLVTEGVTSGNTEQNQ